MCADGCGFLGINPITLMSNVIKTVVQNHILGFSKLYTVDL